MQHLDEGTIHSWLDGALSADESARVTTHVAECAQCAAAVAEARGFIAASSRILTALDHVPRGVVPAAPPVKWHNRAAWRAAAAVLVVAVGSLVVVRNSERKAAVAASSDTIGVVTTAETQPQMATPAPEGAAIRKPQAPAEVALSARKPVTSGVGPSRKPTAEADFSGRELSVAAQPKVVARERARNEAAPEPIDGYAAVRKQAAGVVMAPQPAAPSRLAGATMSDAASEQPPLKVIGTPRTLGAKVTLYEVAPGDTVTLTELMSLQLQSVVVTGSSSAQPLSGRAAGKSAAQTAGAPAVPPAAVPPLQVDVVNGSTTISWPDPTTGNMLKLSGRMPVERLKEIKLRIERERAAAAAKKNP
jgi:hypothetical protein